MSLCETEFSKSGKRPSVEGLACHSDCEEVKPSPFLVRQPDHSSFPHGQVPHWPKPVLALAATGLKFEGGRWGHPNWNSTFLILVSPCI